MMMSTEQDTPSDWRGMGRELVVAVLGTEALAELVREPGIDVSLYETALDFGVAEPGFVPEALDVVVIEQEPWPDVDGVALARGLRRRFIGTVVVGRAGERYLLEERLAVLPRSATGGVSKEDLQAAVAVAAQETWALAPMRDPWREDDASEQTTADHCVEPDVIFAEVASPSPPPVLSVTPSQVRVNAAGEASQSTMVELFGVDAGGGLEALPMPEGAPATGPGGASSRTREWVPSGSLLLETLKGGVVPVGGHATVERPMAAFESDRPGRLPSAAGRLGSRLWFWSAVALGVAAVGLLGVLVWVRG